MIRHNTLDRSVLRQLLRDRILTLGGNRTLRIYGRLDCRAGKRMKANNRVFFRDEAEAIAAGFRPCAVCMPVAYRDWKQTGTSPVTTDFR